MRLTFSNDILAIESADKLTLICVGTQANIKEWSRNIQMHSVGWLNMGRVHSGFAANVHELLGRQDQDESLITHCVNAGNEGIHAMKAMKAMKAMMLIA